MNIKRALMSVGEASSPVFCDGYIRDDSLLFASLWGNEAALLELFARLTIPAHQEGLSGITLTPRVGKKIVLNTSKMSNLKKVTSKTPGDTILGSLCHVWIYDEALEKPNHRQGEAYVINYLDGYSENQLDDQVWSQLQALSVIPLLDHWQKPVMAAVRQVGFIEPVDAFRLSAVKIQLELDEFEALISSLLKSGVISENLSPVQLQPKQTALFG